MSLCIHLILTLNDLFFSDETIMYIALRSYVFEYTLPVLSKFHDFVIYSYLNIVLNFHAVRKWTEFIASLGTDLQRKVEKSHLERMFLVVFPVLIFDRWIFISILVWSNNVLLRQSSWSSSFIVIGFDCNVYINKIPFRWKQTGKSTPAEHHVLSHSADTRLQNMKWGCATKHLY